MPFPKFFDFNGLKENGGQKSQLSAIFLPSGRQNLPIQHMAEISGVTMTKHQALPSVGSEKRGLHAF